MLLCDHSQRVLLSECDLSPQWEAAKPVSASEDSIAPVAKWASGRNGPVEA